MRLPWVLLCACAVPLGLVAATADAVMVDFESPPYTADAGFIGVDGWSPYLTPTTVVTPAAVDSRVLGGSQSGGFPAPCRSCFAPSTPGPTEMGNGTVVSGHMLVDGAGGSGQFYFSQNLATLGHARRHRRQRRGKFRALRQGNPGRRGRGHRHGRSLCAEHGLPSGNRVGPHARSRSTPMPRTSRTAVSRASLGSALLRRRRQLPRSYTTGGFVLISGGNAVAVYDDLDINVAAARRLRSCRARSTSRRRSMLSARASSEWTAGRIFSARRPW